MSDLMGNWGLEQLGRVLETPKRAWKSLPPKSVVCVYPHLLRTCGQGFRGLHRLGSQSHRLAFPQRLVRTPVTASQVYLHTLLGTCEEMMLTFS